MATADLKVLPASIELEPGDAQVFTVEPAGVAVTWALTPPGLGELDATTGVYRAPDNAANRSAVLSDWVKMAALSP